MWTLRSQYVDFDPKNSNLCEKSDDLSTNTTELFENRELVTPTPESLFKLADDQTLLDPLVTNPNDADISIQASKINSDLILNQSTICHLIKYWKNLLIQTIGSLKQLEGQINGAHSMANLCQNQINEFKQKLDTFGCDSFQALEWNDLPNTDQCILRKQKLKVCF